MAQFPSISRVRHCFVSNIYRMHYTVKRGVLSDAYLCEEAWEKRLESPLLRNLKMEQYFLETDKKFGTQRLVSGVEIDLFGNNLQDESQLDELEHLLYRFRRTKRATEMMDSTNYAVVRAFLKYHQYESLFRILNDRDSYGLFPDLYSYNILMSTFLKEKLYKEAARVAILMMLQENFSNQISCVLGILSCQTFLNECSLNLLDDEVEKVEEEPKEDDDDDEETLVRVPFLKNAWFDDHFDLTNPKHLIGKTFYLLGRELNNTLGRSCQLVGLAMYEKWEKAFNLLTNFAESEGSLIMSEVVEKVKLEINSIPEDEEKTKEQWMSKFDELFKKMKLENKLEDGDLTTLVQENVKGILLLQDADIEAQKRLFTEWEDKRRMALDRQNMELDIERRLKAIQEKKEYLFWKEKLLFFFENEDRNLEELKNVEELIASLKKETSVEDSYVVPEMKKTFNVKESKYKRLAKVKRL